MAKRWLALCLLVLGAHMASNFVAIDELTDDSDAGSCHCDIEQSFCAVSELSPDSGEAEGVAAGKDISTVTSSQRRSKKRKREESTERVRRNMTDESKLRGLLQKACVGCKHRCLEKWKNSSMFQKLLDFRKDWASLHKTDQDVVLFNRMKAILHEPRDADALAKWTIFGVRVCLKAWRRIHGIGPLSLLSQSFGPGMICRNNMLQVRIQIVYNNNKRS